MRRVGGLAVVALLLATGCSDDDAPGTAALSTSPSSTIAASSSSTVTTNAAPSSALSSLPSSAPTSVAATTTVPASPAVAEAGGWRLAVTRPVAGATIPATALLCYEVTGAAREPELVLEVTVVNAGATGGTPSLRLPVPVGRGSTPVQFPGARPGRYDLRVELVVNGARMGLTVNIPLLSVADGAPAGACL